MTHDKASQFCVELSALCARYRVELYGMYDGQLALASMREGEFMHYAPRDRKINDNYPLHSERSDVDPRDTSKEQQ